MKCAQFKKIKVFLATYDSSCITLRTAMLFAISRSVKLTQNYTAQNRRPDTTRRNDSTARCGRPDATGASNITRSSIVRHTLFVRNNVTILIFAALILIISLRYSSYFYVRKGKKCIDNRSCALNMYV